MPEVMGRERGRKQTVDSPGGGFSYRRGRPGEPNTPIFVASRTAGWSAHVIEQLDHNRLIRPRSEYTGPEPGRRFVPLAVRGCASCRFGCEWSLRAPGLKSVATAAWSQRLGDITLRSTASTFPCRPAE